MSDKNRIEFIHLTMQLMMLDDVLPTGTSLKALISLPIIFDMTGEYGSTANDLATITGVPYKSVMRHIKIFEEAGLITYEQISDKAKSKYVFLTEKGKALRERIQQPYKDARADFVVDKMLDAIDEANLRGKDIVMDSAQNATESGVAQPVNYRLKTEGLEMKASVGNATVKIVQANDPKVIGNADGPISIDGSENKISVRLSKVTHERLKQMLSGVKTGKEMLDALKETEGADSPHVMTQIIRAVKTAVANGEKQAVWRHALIDVIDAETSLNAFRDGRVQRRQNQGVWMLYEHGDDPSINLPVAVQRDFTPHELTRLLSDKEQQLANFEIAGLGDITFSGVMKELKALMNANQYNRARTALTKAVADFNDEMLKVLANAEKQKFFMQGRSKTNGANAETKKTHETAGDEVLNKDATKESQQKIDDLQFRLDNMERMMAKLLAEKDDKKDG